MVSPSTMAVTSAPRSLFGRSMALSAARCMLTYVVLPFVLPIVGWTAGTGSAIGLVLGPVAIAANLYSLTHFWTNDHRYKLVATVLHVAMVVGLTLLLMGDAIATFG